MTKKSRNAIAGAPRSNYSNHLLTKIGSSRRGDDPLLPSPSLLARLALAHHDGDRFLLRRPEGESEGVLP
jgi:hypothetical protein